MTQKYNQASWAKGIIRKDLYPLAMGNNNVYFTGANDIHNANIINPVGIERREGFEFMTKSKIASTNNTKLIVFTHGDDRFLILFSYNKIEVLRGDGTKHQWNIKERVLADGVHDRDTTGHIIRRGEIILDRDEDFNGEITRYQKIDRLTENVGTNQNWWLRNRKGDPIVDAVSYKVRRKDSPFPYTNDDILNIRYVVGTNGIIIVDGKHYPTVIGYYKETKAFKFEELYIINNQNTKYIESLKKAWTYTDPSDPKYKPPVKPPLNVGNIPEIAVAFDEDYDKDTHGNNSNWRIYYPFGEVVGEHHVGFPKVVAIFDNRLIFANTEKYPNYIWCSQRDVFSSDDHYANFSLGTEANDGIEVALDIGTGKINNIVHGSSMQIFTAQGIYVTTESFISPEQNGFTLNKQSENHIDNNIKPVYENGRTIYVHGDTIKYLVYEYNADKGRTLYSSYLLSDYMPSIKDITKIQYVQSIDTHNTDRLFVLTARDELLSINLSNISEQTGTATSAGLNRWYTNGEIETNLNSDPIEDVAVNDKEVYLLVKRGNSLSLEKLNKNNDLDCSVKGTDLLSIEGRVSHLEGQKVAVIFNNTYFNDTVLNGKLVDFPKYANDMNEIKEIEVGLPFYFRLDSLPVIAGQKFSIFSRNTKLHNFNFFFSYSLNAILQIKTTEQKYDIDLIAQYFPITNDDPTLEHEQIIDKHEDFYHSNKYSIIQKKSMKLRLLSLEILIGTNAK